MTERSRAVLAADSNLSEILMCTDTSNETHNKSAEQSRSGSSGQLELNEGLAPLISVLFVCPFVLGRGLALRAAGSGDFWKIKKGPRTGTDGEHAAAALCTHPASLSPTFPILLLLRVRLSPLLAQTHSMVHFNCEDTQWHSAFPGPLINQFLTLKLLLKVVRTSQIVLTRSV